LFAFDLLLIDDYDVSMPTCQYSLIQRGDPSDTENAPGNVDGERCGTVPHTAKKPEVSQQHYHRMTDYHVHYYH